MSGAIVSLSRLIAEKVPTVDPAKFPDEEFELWSIPAFDAGQPEIVKGLKIGSSKQIVEPGDVLLSKIVPHIRRGWVVTEAGRRRQIASGEWIVFRGATFDSKFLRHILVSNDFHAMFMMTVAGVGGSLLRARPQAVKALSIFLPPLSEQKRIAAILDQADDLRRKQSRSTYLAGTLEQALFRATFDGCEQPSVTSTSLGPHISFVTSGGRGWAKYYSDHGERFIRSMDVRMGYISEDEPAFVNVKPSAETRRTKIQDNDILLTITGSRIGRVAHVPIDWGCGYISQHVAIIRLNQERLDPRFVAFYMTLPEGGQRQILKMQYGQSKPGLNFDQIARFEIPVPSLADQAKFLNDLDQLKTVQSARAHAAVNADALFTSLQHRAFRGEL